MTTTCLRCHGLHRLVLSWCLRCHSLHRLVASMCKRCHSPRRLVASMCMRCHNHHRLVASMCMMRCDNLHYKRNRHMHNKRPHDNKKCLQKKFLHKKVPARSQKFENCIQCTKGDPMCRSQMSRMRPSGLPMTSSSLRTESLKSQDLRRPSPANGNQFKPRHQAKSSM